MVSQKFYVHEINKNVKKEEEKYFWSTNPCRVNYNVFVLGYNNINRFVTGDLLT